MQNVQVALINASTQLSDQEVQSALPALQTQIHRDFAPAWGIDADLEFISGAHQQPPLNKWWVVVLDNPDQAVMLGYHDQTNQGLPLGKIFVSPDKQMGYQWTVIASHILLETLADPDINRVACVQRHDSSIFYACDICDPCQSEQNGYNIDDTRVSDFVYPSWFESFRAPNSTQFDQCDKIEKPFALLSGGYCTVLDMKTALAGRP
ncbi:MAG: hypothetical protein J2P37_15265, partial [Ktedonobacteraceae bacterium]|nr:hypothetical protein [Ktedonobacteraceae bacterium]